MKKILSILAILLLPIMLFAQPIGGKNSTVEVLGGIKVDSALQIPPHTSFTNKGVSTTGRIDYETSGSLPEYSKSGTWKRMLTVFDSATLYLAAQQAGVANGVATLDVTGKVPSGQLPAITISGQVYVDTNQAEMLSHTTATAGALSIRTDSSNELFCLTQTPYNVRANWHITQGNGVSAFNGRSGAVIPRLGDYNTDSVAEGSVNQYFQPIRVQAVVATDTGSAGWLATNAGLRDSAAALRSTIGGSVGLNQVLANSNTSNRYIKIGRAKSGAAFPYGQTTLGTSFPDSSGAIVLSDTIGSSSLSMVALAGQPEINMFCPGGASVFLDAAVGSTSLVLNNGSFSCTLSPQTLSMASGQGIDASGISLKHAVGIGSTPSISAGGGAGSSPTVNITGTDVAGNITVTAGTSPLSTTTIATITFATAFSGTPTCILLTPGNQNAARLSAASQVYVPVSGISSTQFSITSNATPLTTLQAYQWYYTIIK